jgi:PHP family Zn ribbon phosphoesterase
MMRTWLAELHVHTVLSPCAAVEMIPPLIVEEALQRGIQVIAITDHNASANIAAVQSAALGSGLVVLPGMELQTREEVHLLCLFDTLDQVSALQASVDQRLPPIKNRPDFFGEQFVVDATGDYIRSDERLLLTSVDLSLEEAVMAVRQAGGLVIPAHVDRKAFSLLSILGFVPPELAFPALEISFRHTPDSARQAFPQIAGYPLIQSGDVHNLGDFLAVTELYIESPCLSEIHLALAGADGRKVHIRERAMG